MGLGRKISSIDLPQTKSRTKGQWYKTNLMPYVQMNSNLSALST